MVYLTKAKARSNTNESSRLASPQNGVGPVRERFFCFRLIPNMGAEAQWTDMSTSGQTMTMQEAIPTVRLLVEAKGKGARWAKGPRDSNGLFGVENVEQYGAKDDGGLKVRG